MNILIFFKSSHYVCAIPSWRNPRLYVKSGSFFEKWIWSDLYPASKLLGRFRKVIFRIVLSFGFLQKKKAPQNNMVQSQINEFLGGDLFVCSVIVNYLNKMTMEVRDANQKIRAYLKYGESEITIGKIKNELLLLKSLPSNIAPSVLNYGPLHMGYGLLISPIFGKPINNFRLCTSDIIDYSQKLVKKNTYKFDNHPWVIELKKRFNDGFIWADSLRRSDWNTVFFHGDFTPWNLVKTPTGKLYAIDWENGSEYGFPYIDIFYYNLRILSFIYRINPTMVFGQILSWVKKKIPNFNNEYIYPIYRLAVLYDYSQRIKDGFNLEDKHTSWLFSILNLEES